MNQNRLPSRQAVSAARRAEMLNEAWGRNPRHNTTPNFLDDWEIPFVAAKRAKPVFIVALGIWITSIILGLVLIGLVIWGGVEAIMWLRDQ